MTLALFDQRGRPTGEALGRALKARGQQLALDGAGAQWASQIISELRAWCALRRGQCVTIEEFRQQVPSALQPRTAKAWGVVPGLAVKAGLIEATGQYVTAQSPRTRAHPIRVWRVI